MALLKTYANVDLIANGQTPLFVAAPVSAGLVGYYELGGADSGAPARSLVNLAYQGAQGATVVGTPTYDAADMGFAQNINFIQTPLPDTVSGTVILVGSTSTAGVSNAMFFGTYQAPGSPGIGVGFNMAALPGGSINVLIRTTSADGTTGELLSKVLAVTDWTTPKAIAVSYDDPSGVLTLYNLTEGTSATANKTAGHIRPLATSNHRIGSTYNAAAAQSKVSMLARYNRALSAAEIAAMYAFVKKRAAKRGLTV